jgi:Fe-S-cluster-containing dehydrogenase component
MARYAMLIDVNKCSGCYNCFLACKDEHSGKDSGAAKPQPDTGHFWMNIIEKERGQYPKVEVATIPVPCMHCDDAACVAKAKNGAVYQRKDGIVIIDPEKSKNQKQLLDVCPYNAIFWNEQEQTPQKCTMCAHLLDQGWKEPRCVQACPTGALVFGDVEDTNSEIAKLIAQANVENLYPETDAKPAVKYIGLPRKFVAGTVYFSDVDECAEHVAVVIKTKDFHDRTLTNIFGDFEFEGLADNTEYEVSIKHDGYESVNCKVTTDRDVYMGGISLVKK